MKRFLLATGAAIVAVATAPMAPANAQGAVQANDERAAAEASLDGEIVVTAQKRAESLRDVPMSITALSGSQLAARGVIDTADLQKVVSGFTFNTDARGAVVYTIRGIGFQESTLAASSTVSVYVDEVPLPYSFMTLGGTLDLARVEVLKGPQGTLYGQNSTGGLVNYIAAKPTDVLAAGVNARYGRFNTADLAAYVSGPIAENLNARLAVRTVQADSWQKSHTRNESLGKKDQLFGRLLLDWQATDRLKISVNLNAWRDRSETQASQLRGVAFQVQNPVRWFLPLLDTPVSPSNARAADWTPGRNYKRNNRFKQATGRADYEITDDVTFTSLTSYQKFKLFLPLDNDGSTFENAFATRTGNVETFFQELRLSGDFGNGGNWIVGANYQRDDTFERVLPEFPQSSQRHLGRSIATDADQLIKSYSAYTSVNYPITDTVQLIGGIRYTKQDRAFAGCSRDTGDGLIAQYFNGLTGVPNNFGPGDCITLLTATTGGLVRSNLNEDNISWKAGIKFTPSTALMLYANATRGYKGGSYTTVAATRAAQLDPVSQESVLAFEAGFKASLLDRALQLNGAVYYYDYKDKQLRGRRDVPPFGALEGLVNIPKSHIIGAEIEAIIRPFDGLTIAPSLSYVKSKIEAPFVNFRGDGFPPAVDLSGEPFPYTPKWTGNTDVQYEWGLSDTMNAYVGTNVSFQAHTFSGLGQQPDYRIPAYTLIDLRAGVRSADGNWDASIWGKNVTNKYYWISVAHLGDVVSRTTGMPATYGVALTWRY